jgi:nucleotide-binding universal stress UspA family protein
MDLEQEAPMKKMSILVPLDGSLFSEYALPQALAVARVLDANIEIVSVVPDLQLIAVGDPTVASIPPSVVEEDKWRAEEYLDKVAASLVGNSSEVEVSTKALQGDIAQAIENHVTQTHPTLIVMSSHGRGALSRAWLGSIADQLVRHANVPVLIVRPGEQNTDALPPVVATDLKNILVPVDGGSLSKKGLAWAVRLAKNSGAHLVLARVVQPPPAYESPYFPGDAVAVPLHQRGIPEELAAADLNAMKNELADRGFDASTEIISCVQIASGLLSCAEEVEADLIVIATHGRGGLARATLGSVADKVVRGAEMPVLVVRGTE